MFTVWWTERYSCCLQVDSRYGVCRCAGVQVCRCAGVQRLRFAIKMYSQLSATNKQTDKRTELTYFQYYTRQLEILKCAVQSTD